MIGIIGFNSLHVMQYLYKYTDLLDEAGADYELVFWDRTENGEENPFGDKSRVFRCPTVTHQPFYKKIGGFLRYAHFMRKTVRERGYERLILLTSQTAVALSGLALKKYDGKYVYDFRDLTREYNPLYRRLIEKLIDHSAFTAISSRGFLKTLTGCNQKKFVSSNNLRALTEADFSPAPREPSAPIRVVFWGIIRQIDYQKALCGLFGGDQRFQLVYHGSGVWQELRDYCARMGYSNIAFTGPYPASRTEGFARETDLLLNAFQNDFEQKDALTVKLLDGMRYRLPMLVAEGSYMAEYVKPYGVALAIDPERAGETDRIKSWLDGLSKGQTRSGYQKMRTEIERDEAAFRRAVLRFIGEEEK